MINAVRKTVLSILNKDNDGYLTPEEFNLYADMAQNEIFEQYFHDYSLAVNKRNKHMHTSGLGDIAGRLAEVIELFTYEDSLIYNAITQRFTLPTDVYKMELMYSSSNGNEIERIPGNKIRNLISSLDTVPDTNFPVYTLINDEEAQVYPTTINTTGDVVLEYIRFPKTPKWTYSTLSGGEPLFNQSQSDYQDFELPIDDMANIIAKICQYAGTQIREPEVVRYMQTEELREKQEQK